MREIEVDQLQCPDCSGHINRLLRCMQCGKQFNYEFGVYNLLPEHLEQVKKNEDLVFAAEGHELSKTRGRPWRRIVCRPELLRFDYEVLSLYRGGRFLELGGETCFASAMFKSVFPDSIVYASDASPNALHHAAIPTCALFPRQPDFFVALDAEDIPFRNETFDSIFSLTMMHHLPSPVRMLNEVHRVMKPGATFVAIDACVPTHFRWLFSRAAQQRATRYGIREDLIPYSRWVAMVSESRLPLNSLRTYTDPRYQREPLRALAGSIVHRLPSQVARLLFPTGIMIVYEKPY